MNGFVGSWSASAILTGIGHASDRLGGTSATEPTGPVVSFERALAAELQRAGDLDPFNAGSLDPQNGAALNRAGESWSTVRTEAAAGHNIPGVDVDDAVVSKSADRRVDFDRDDGASRLAAGGNKSSDADAFPDDRSAFWVGDRVATVTAQPDDGLDPTNMPLAEPAFSGRVFFNGDGRPILVSPVGGAEQESPVDDEGPSPDGDLMILPSGAVMPYDPWTAAVDDGAVSSAASAH